jgi:hypothetical protein
MTEHDLQAHLENEISDAEKSLAFWQEQLSISRDSDSAPKAVAAFESIIKELRAARNA